MKQLTLIRLFALALGCILSAWAQTIDTGIYATASRTVSLTPAEAGIRITVSASAQKTLDDVVAAVKDLGAGVENLLNLLDLTGSIPSIPNVPAIGTPVTYTFSIRVPLSQVRATLQKIAQIPATVDLRVAGSMSGVYISKATYEDNQRRLFSDLFKEAKARADQMAKDAGLGSGPRSRDRRYQRPGAVHFIAPRIGRNYLFRVRSGGDRVEKPGH